MKQVDPSFTTIHKTLCPFCSYGCELGIVLDDFGIKGVEYLKDGSTSGRLCPRGSAAALYLNHPRRLTRPFRNGNPIEWQKLIKDLKKTIEHPQNTAITFDRNITREEHEAIVRFCTNHNIECCSSSYLEPDALLSRFMKGPHSPDDIEHAQVVFVIGDPFSFSPMVSKTLINWRLNNRRHRLVVVDVVNTHTAGFATDFLRVKLGSEPIVLYYLSQALPKTIDVTATTGISRQQIDSIAEVLKNAQKGVILASFSFAHTYDPLLLVEGLARVSEVTGMKVMPFIEHPGYEGNMDLGSVFSLIKKKKIKYLINFGELFPFYYPQLAREYRGVHIYAMSPLKFEEHTVLPAALNLEKEGTIPTTFGIGRLPGAVAPASGARTVIDILSMLGKVDGKKTNLRSPEKRIDVDERLLRLAEPLKSSRRKKNKVITLIGEKIAYHYLGFLEEEYLKINPFDAAEINVTQGEVVVIRSPHGQCEVPVHISEDCGAGIAAVQAETQPLRGLFSYEVNDTVYFTPTEVEIWRKG